MSNNVTVSYQNYIDGKWVDSASKREYPLLIQLIKLRLSETSNYQT